jgi:hypothetical protein
MMELNRTAFIAVTGNALSKFAPGTLGESQAAFSVLPPERIPTNPKFPPVESVGALAAL